MYDKKSPDGTVSLKKRFNSKLQITKQAMVLTEPFW